MIQLVFNAPTWPTGPHRLLLQAALHPDPDATHRISSYLDFVCIRWDLPNRWHLPASFLHRAFCYFSGTPL